MMSIQLRLSRPWRWVPPVFLALLPLLHLEAADLTWGGIYRVEAVKLKNTELTSDDSNKAYALHHLVLTPKIVAADGLTIHTRFDLFNNSNFGAHQQVGEVFGLGPTPGTRTSPITSSEASQSNTLSKTQKSGDLAVTELYANWTQEFGQLVVGRTPLHFGLGTAYNAGRGPFDHYLETRDLFGYKVIFGNLYAMPIIGKVNEGGLGDEDDINDYLLHIQYDNPETELSLGFMYQLRIGTHASGKNDLPAFDGGFGGANATVVDGFKSTLISLYSSQKLGDFRIGVEGNLLSGDTGVRTVTGSDVSLNAFAFAGELDWKPDESSFSASLRAGVATGDDPGTDDSYEGFVFSKNYDVAMLMFNHPLGQANNDFFRTGLTRDVSVKPSNQVDTEGISNAIYIAPRLRYQSGDRTAWETSVITGMLNKEPFRGGDTSRNLGFEVDLSFHYQPFDRMIWTTEAGILFPGEAWKAGSLGLENKVTYGLITKAAITF